MNGWSLQWFVHASAAGRGVAIAAILSRGRCAGSDLSPSGWGTPSRARTRVRHVDLEEWSDLWPIIGSSRGELILAFGDADRDALMGSVRSFVCGGFGLVDS